MAFGSYVFVFMFWFLMTLIGVVMLLPYGFFVWWLQKKFRFRSKAVILEQVNGQYYLGAERQAKEFIGSPDEKGIRRTFLELATPFKGFKRIPLSDNASYIPFSGWFGATKVVNLVFANGAFTPLNVEANSAAVFKAATINIPDFMNAFDAANNTNLDLHRPKSSFWDKWGNLLVNGTAMAMHFILIIVIVAMLKSGGGGLPQIIN